MMLMIVLVSASWLATNPLWLRLPSAETTNLAADFPSSAHTPTALASRSGSSSLCELLESLLTFRLLCIELHNVVICTSLLIMVVTEINRSHWKMSGIVSPHWAFSDLTLVVGIRKSIWPVKNWVMGCWCGYLFGAWCILFAYGPTDATAVPKPHHLLPHLNPDWFYLFGSGLPRLSWKKRQLNRCSSSSKPTCGIVSSWYVHHATSAHWGVSEWLDVYQIMASCDVHHVLCQCY